MARRSRAAEPERALKDEIVAATGRLLAERRFDEITVADILAAANVARGSFYFYFDSKHDVLAELVTRAIGRGHEASQTWLEHRDGDQRRRAVRQSIADGARLWADQAPVLRAIVENWRSDPRLTELWLAQMAGFTAITAATIEPDLAGHTAAGHTAAGEDVEAETLAAALTWLGERLYYLAAIGVPPFDDQEKLVNVLTHIWMTAVYRS
jgi:TetR/AcrR family transcriptional regulator, ethionamide resistance regulator